MAENGTLTNTVVSDWFDEAFATTPVMAILRATGRERSLQLAHTAWDLGIRTVEVTVQSPEDLEALTAVAAAGRERDLAVGAGTVMTRQGVLDAAEAGAAFLVSPGLDLDLVEFAHTRGLPFLPGVSTAGEIQAASTAGLRWLKAFPAAALGHAWFTAMRGPFPQVSFVATGGMNAALTPSYLDAGVKVVAVGSALANPEELAALAEVMKR